MKEAKGIKNYIALNTHLLLNLFLFIAFATISILCALEKQAVLSIAFGFFAILPALVFFISPVYFVFNEDFVKIVYALGQNETIFWKSVKKISLFGSLLGGGALPYYSIYYPKQEKCLFFVKGEIPKTGKTKKLIGMFYKKDIEK